MQTFIKTFSKDARHYQILFLAAFLLYGINHLGWSYNLTPYFLIFSICILSQSFFCWYYSINISAIKSALISALGLSLLLKTENIWLICLASFLTISSKFLIRYKNKHLFNPVNFGIIVCILFSGEAWISPGKWGNTGFIFFLVGSLGVLVLGKVKRLETSIAFFGSFFILEYFYQVLYKGWPIDFIFHSFTSGALLLFSFFMITDPRTSPNHVIARVSWAVGIAITSFILQEYFYLKSAPFYVLFFASTLTPFLDHLFKADAFTWKVTPKSMKHNY